jgi:hypothetical protein
MILNLFHFWARLLAIAEETLTEFLSKATGTAIDWVQMPGMKVIDNFRVFNVLCSGMKIKLIETCLCRSLFCD